MRKESFHWFLGDVRGITNTIIHGILTNLPHGYSGSCFQRYWQVLSIENQTDLITGLVLMVWFWQKSTQPIADHPWYRPAYQEIEVLSTCDANNSNSQLRGELNWGFHVFSFIRTNLRTGGRSLLWLATKHLTFQEFSEQRSLQDNEAF